MGRLILAHSMFRSSGRQNFWGRGAGPARFDFFLHFPFWKDVVVLKELIFDNFYLERM